MYKEKKNGFTLVEMLIVLFIITVLTLLFVPQISKRAENVSDNGCEALEKTVIAQANAYYLEKNDWPDLDELQSAGYIEEDQKTCKNDKPIVLPSKPFGS